MSKRRLHWDRELEQAVSLILFDCYENGVSEAQVWQIIAAVEDWAKWGHVPEGTLAAIQRVRELCEDSRVAMSKGCLCYTDECSGCGYGTPLAWDLNPEDVLRALDGA